MPEKPTLFVCHGDDGGPRTLKLADGTVITHSRAIFAWIGQQTA